VKQSTTKDAYGLATSTIEQSKHCSFTHLQRSLNYLWIVSTQRKAIPARSAPVLMRKPHPATARPKRREASNCEAVADEARSFEALFEDRGDSPSDQI
jgi:hypothetical protein